MNLQFLERILHFLAGVGWVMGMVWLGLCVFSVGLLILMYTRWGQSHPLEKCMGLSLLAHGLLLGYATTISLAAAPLPPGEPAFQVALVEGDAEENAVPASTVSSGESLTKTDQPWEVLQHEAAAQPAPAKLERQKTDSPPPERIVHVDVDKLPGDPALEKTAVSKIAAPEPKMTDFDEPLTPDVPAELVAPPLEAPPAQNREPSEPASITALPQSPVSNPFRAGESSPEPTRSSVSDIPRELLQPMVSPPRIGSPAMPEPGDSLGDATFSNEPGGRPARANAASEIPEMYKLRVMPNRSDVTRHHGGSPETEKAVQAALKWLADNQAADGRWKAGEHGAGRDENVLGHARQNAGSEADTGVTGLALLAFLAAGNTHQQGEYKDNIRHGLEFLLRSQARDGNLGGSAAIYEFMYCHAMATCALSEVFGMTHEERLREPVQARFATPSPRRILKAAGGGIGPAIPAIPANLAGS